MIRPEKLTRSIERTVSPSRRLHSAGQSHFRHSIDDYQRQTREAEEELGWRQTAQMLSDDDEIILATSNQQRADNKMSSSARATPDSGSSRDFRRPRDHYLLNQNRDQEEGDDDDSSISFARSGCHSILSAWRLKAGNKASRQQQLSKLNRPTSVLSNASSAKKSVASTAFTLRSSGRAPASQTRIPLGPRQAQHFVTNTRRRRRANELILNTLEARRRALALNRQNASLLGSGSYLNATDFLAEHSLLGLEAGQLLFGASGGEQNQRLSLSPSPVAGYASRSPSPAPRRSALSDLGGARSSPAVVKRELVQLRKLSAPRQPPLAKLDQNSSDLYTSNSSSSSDSDGSQFTQLVTSEQAPDCVLLEEQALRARVGPATTKLRPEAARRTPPAIARQASAAVGSSHKQSGTTKGSERRKRTQESKQEPETADNASNKLRRGALRRDSIRRLRLNRQQQVQPARAKQESISSSSSSSSTASETNPFPSHNSLTHQHPVVRQQALPLARKLDIENNPFLNRGHFRSTSVRSASAPRSEISSSIPASARSRIEQHDQQLELTGIGSRPGEQSLQARRSKSTEPAEHNNHFNETNKVGKQRRDAVQREGEARRQQEQVFASTSSSGRRQQVAAASQHRPTREPQGQPLEASSSSSPTRKEPTVKEGSSSRSDLRFDALGNRTRLDSEHVWRREESSSPQRGASRSEQRIFRSEKMELFRQTPTSISPPMGFSDKKPARAQSSERNPQQQQRAASRAENQNQQVTEGRWPASRASELKPQVSHQQQRATSVERPVVPARKKPPQVAPRPASLQPAHRAPTLPTFEPTADDEFRKRVDYLRRLAKANLDSSAPIERATEARAAQKPLTRPPTTNWRHSVEPLTAARARQLPGARPATSPKPSPPPRAERPVPSSASFFDERAKWKSGPLAEKQQQEARRSPATTNLDSILAERYQQKASMAPLPASRWHRSNSSLASLGRNNGQNSGAESRPSGLARPSSPAASFAQPSVRTAPSGMRQQNPLMGATLEQQQRASSAREEGLPGPREQTSGSPVKLVVKERSAPRLNYAFVEQQPSVQQVVKRVLPSMASEQQQEAAGSRSGSGGLQRQMLGEPGRRSPLRVAASRSPEFGAMAASSNDDSAIASSVSSPSLSYMLNSSSKQLPGQPLAGSCASSTKPQLVGLRQVRSLEAGNASGALQSILRRAQQHSGDSSDSSASQQQQLSTGQLKQEPRLEQPQLQQQRPVSPRPQPAALQESSPPKRVHFNDRTSVRSFESISSLNSNSTAVPNELALLRQQVGSPDSMGSGSGRLSAESPDNRKSGGAAIYAIRGDPELEGLDHATGGLASAVGMQTTAQLTRQPFRLQPQQQPAPSSRFLNTSEQMMAPAGLQRRQLQLQTGQPLIKMSAPASISSGCPPPQQQVHGYIVRPTSSTSTHIIPTVAVAPTSFQRKPPIGQELEEDEDPGYSLRLRQAASSRMMQYAPSAPLPPLLSPQQRMVVGQQMLSPSQQAVNLQHRQQQHTQQASQGAPLKRTLNVDDYLNFQTEV